MNDNNTNNTDTEVHIEQVNPRKELNDLEKTAILQFKLEEEEKLGKTMQFKIFNTKTRQDDINLPKKSLNLADTIKLKISDLRANIEQQEIESLNIEETPKKSIYDTIIIKLDDLINSRNALKKDTSKKITSIENTKCTKNIIHLFKPKDITKVDNFKLNIDSDEFGRQLYNLNKYALDILSFNRPKEVRGFNNNSTKLEKIEKIHISKDNYLQYQQKLQKFAINKLYYKLAPKESNKYKLYKYSVILSSCVFFITSLIIVNWFVQGISINNISNSLKEETKIEQISDGTLFNMKEPVIEEPIVNEGNTPIIEEEAPVPEKKEEYSNKNTMYWQYLNTPLSSVDFTELVKQNSDTVGWLIVNNTNVNYPVVQTSDNDYYLKHAFNRTKNSAGWVYADFRNNFDNLSKNTVIYAHGRKDKVMFGSLTNTLKENWYKNTDNQIIQFSTLKFNTMWQIISIYKIEAESYYITTDFSSDESFENFIQTMKQRSIYDFGIDVNKDDKLLTLSTCYNDNGIRLVVQAKLVKIQER